MKIGFLSDSYNDPERIGSWSGLPYYFARHLRAAGCEIVPIRGRDAIGSLSEKLKQAVWRLLGKRYLRGLNPTLLRAYARSVEPLLRETGVDAVFSVNTWLLAYLETDLPIAFWSDATFAAMLGFYDSFSNLAPVSLRHGYEVEREALRRCSIAGYSSHWAAASAVADHGLDPAKVLLLPFGANLEPMPERENVLASIDAKLSDANRKVCQLLCIGVDWKRKGIALAVEAAEELARRGIPTRLRIAGCQPPNGVALPDNVEVFGFLDKNSSQGQVQLQTLYRDSHFFLLPSRAEAYGVVLSEACSYGVPCLATKVGGLPDVIHAGINGQLFSLDAPGSEYADWIAALWCDPVRYRQMSVATLDDYHARLCGRSAAHRLAEAVQGFVDHCSAQPVTA